MRAAIASASPVMGGDERPAAVLAPETCTTGTTGTTEGPKSDPAPAPVLAPMTLYQWRRARGDCTSCGAPADSAVRCVPCTERVSAQRGEDVTAYAWLNIAAAQGQSSAGRESTEALQGVLDALRHPFSIVPRTPKVAARCAPSENGVPEWAFWRRKVSSIPAHFARRRA